MYVEHRKTAQKGNFLYVSENANNYIYHGVITSLYRYIVKNRYNGFCSCDDDMRETTPQIKQSTVPTVGVARET